MLPLIPSEGSVGASGDLTPLSYLAAVLCGEGEVCRDGSTMPAAAALAEAGIAPLRLRPKEALAIMNGTAVMTALACLAYARAEYLTRLATRITAMASFALDGNADHFDADAVFGQAPSRPAAVAAWLRQDLAMRSAGEQRQPAAGPLFDPLRAARHRRARRRAAVDAPVRSKTSSTAPTTTRSSTPAANGSCTAATSTAATSPLPWTA